jgi:hypothetical protein
MALPPFLSCLFLLGGAAQCFLAILEGVRKSNINISLKTSLFGISLIEGLELSPTKNDVVERENFHSTFRLERCSLRQSCNSHFP